ncbi:MAG: hypothetical protein RLZZ182_873 [Pseudomonadota bacterium]
MNLRFATSRLRIWLTGVVGLVLAVHGQAALADQALVAVAANFAPAMARIAASFERDTGHTLAITAGATGKFNAQIRAGAPFDVLLAADDDTPRQLESDGLAVKGKRFTYARGKLVLWSARPGVVDAQGAVLKQGAFERLALANPKLAPYGTAAMEVISRLGLAERLLPRIVQGESIAQAYQFVSTGNAYLGFVALSQVTPPDRTPTGSWWVVPGHLYTPLLQDAVLLQHGQNNAAAKALMAYLRTDKARTVIGAYGYEF